MAKKFITFSLLLTAVSMMGCGSSSAPSKISEEDKNAFYVCKQKTDIVKNTLSELSLEESGEFDDSTKSKLGAPYQRNEKAYYHELSTGKYLTLQNFGLYVLSSAFHAANYGYESESIGFDEMIYDEVQNELNGDYRKDLKNNGKTHPFYMLIEKEENHYHFKVDWLCDGVIRGNIYVNGEIACEGKDVKEFTLTSYTEDGSCFLFVAHYDFVSNDFYLFNTSHDDKDYIAATKNIIDKLNHQQLTAEELESTEYQSISLATGKITKNPKDVHYRGYLRDAWGENEDKTAFNEIFDSLKDKIAKASIRTSDEKLDYSRSKRVHFMDAALQYGLDTTKLYITRGGSAVFSYIGKDELIALCENGPAPYASFLSKVKAHLSEVEEEAYSLDYHDDVLGFKTLAVNERYYSLNTYSVDQLRFALTYKSDGGENVLYLMVKGDSMIVLGYGCMHDVPKTGEIQSSGGYIYHEYPIEETTQDSEQTRLENGLFQKTVDTHQYARCQYCGELVEVAKSSETYVGYYAYENENYIQLEEYDPYCCELTKGEYYSYNFVTGEWDSSGYQDNEYVYNEEPFMFYASSKNAEVVFGDLFVEMNERYEKTFEPIENGYRMSEVLYSHDELLSDSYTDFMALQEEDKVTFQSFTYQKDDPSDEGSPYSLSNSLEATIQRLEEHTIDIQETCIFPMQDYTFHFHQVFEYEPNAFMEPTLKHYLRESVIPDSLRERWEQSMSEYAMETLESLYQNLNISYQDADEGRIVTLEYQNKEGQTIRQESMSIEANQQIIESALYERVVMGGNVRDELNRKYYSILGNTLFE